jgi:hypothetical protein
VLIFSSAITTFEEDRVTPTTYMPSPVVPYNVLICFFSWNQGCPFFLAAYLDSGLQKLEELQQPRSNLKKKLRPTSNPLWNEEFLPDPKWNWVQQL